MGATLAEYALLAAAAWVAVTLGADQSQHYASSNQYLAGKGTEIVFAARAAAQTKRDAAAVVAQQRANVLKPLFKPERIEQKVKWANAKYDALYATKQTKVDKAYQEKRQKAIAVASGVKRPKNEQKKNIVTSILTRGGRAAAVPAGKVLKQLAAKAKAKNIESKTGRLKEARAMVAHRTAMSPQPGAATKAAVQADRDKRDNADQQKLDAMTQMANAVATMAQQRAPTSSQAPTRAQSHAADDFDVNFGYDGLDDEGDEDSRNVTRPRATPGTRRALAMKSAKVSGGNAPTVAAINAAAIQRAAGILAKKRATMAQDGNPAMEMSRAAAQATRAAGDDDGGYSEL